MTMESGPGDEIGRVTHICADLGCQFGLRDICGWDAMAIHRAHQGDAVQETSQNVLRAAAARVTGSAEVAACRAGLWNSQRCGGDGEGG